MTHKSQEILKREIDEAAKQVAVGGVYVHYKSASMRYEVINLAINTDKDEVCVVYQALYGEHIVFARSLQEWLDVVEVESIKMKRFTEE